jgi:anthranilate synthase component 1
MTRAAQATMRVRTRTHRFTTQAEAFDLFVELVREHGEDQAFLLDSITDARTQYCSSIIGLFPLLRVAGRGKQMTVTGVESVLRELPVGRSIVVEKDLPLHLDAIQAAFAVDASLPAYSFGYLGFFGHDSIRHFEDIPANTMDDRGIDDFCLQIHRIIIHVTPETTTVYLHEFDGVEGPGIRSVVAAAERAAREQPKFEGYDRSALVVAEDVEYADYVRRIERVKEYILAGDVFQCVISKRMRITGKLDTLQAYGQLRRMNPSPYMFYANYGSYLIFGASPEMQVRVEGGMAQMKPIAGTSKGKGTTPQENQALCDALLSDPKERAEHVMLVDLCRNDLGRVAVPGSVKVEHLLEIEEYSHVFHLVSHVTARVRPEVSPFDVFLATFPAGTLTGAPKVRALQIIDELEDFHRGPYGGVIGMFDHFGNLDTAIVIRTVVCQGDVAYLQAGAGIVADSVPDQEWRECDHKLGALRATIC